MRGRKWEGKMRENGKEKKWGKPVRVGGKKKQKRKKMEEEMRESTMVFVKKKKGNEGKSLEMERSWGDESS